MRKKLGGFSLIELMITVAALGLLAAIAVPNYVAQMQVAQQKEAKAGLAQLTGAMKSFFSEYAGVTSRFDVLGFNPAGNFHYVFGFGADKAAPASADFAGNASGVCMDTIQATGATCGGAGPFVYTPKWTNAVTATNAGTIAAYLAAHPLLPVSFPVGGGPWVAYAISSLHGTSNLDGWSIDSHDDLINTTPGI